MRSRCRRSVAGDAADRVEPMSRDAAAPRSTVHGPLATPEAIAGEPVPFPSVTSDAPLESGFMDWRQRLTGNLSRRSDGRWAPLTRIHRLEGRSDAGVRATDKAPPPAHS